MPKMMLRLVVVVTIILSSAHVDTSTHWIVTEDGKLQEQTDSMLSMTRPHDLVAFMHQEERVNDIEELKAYIVKHQDVVDSTDEKDDGFEERFLATEDSCVKAVKRLPEFDLYISTVLPLENKGIKADDHINLNLSPPTKYLQPLCNSPLDFSMYAFEHLEGVQSRASLQGSPEMGLKSAITNRESEDEYGHLVHEAMKQNQTSWILYNMAAFYWRIKGNSNEAIECLRRAMHYSPGDYRDIAYVSLGNILHRSRIYSHEAAVVVEAALGLSHSLNVNHFTLGNIYAVLTEYNKSIACFDNTLEIQPDFEAAEKRRWAVICHAKLEQALEGQHKTLQVALEKLKEYQRKHESMKALTEKITREQAPRTNRLMKNAEFSRYRHRRRETDGALMGENCEVTRLGDEQSIECKWRRHIRETDFSYNSSDADIRFSNIPISEDEIQRIREHADYDRELFDLPPLEKKRPTRTAIHAADSKQDYSKPIRPPTYAAGETAPITETSEEKPNYMKTSWPSREECEEHQTVTLDWNEYPTTFLPPENKGFESRVFLTEAIDIQQGDQHPLPWYPPVCVNIVDLKQGEMFLDHVASIRDRDQVPLRLNDPSMKTIMLSWVNDGDVEEEEVGQRILTALKQNLAPRWLLYNLAGLYWRVVGNNYHAIECLRRSLHFVPADYVDVPLVNMANIFYKWNKLDDALNMTRQALIFCPFEPITHFTQANLLAAKKNESGAVYHYEKALEYDPSYGPALKMLRNLKCYSKYHKAALAQADKNTCKAGTKRQSCGSGVPSCATITQCAEDVDLVDPRDTDTVLTLGAFLRKSKMIDPTEADAMKEFHKTQGLCTGPECDHIVHRPGTEPYIKIKAVAAGKWLQRLLFINPEEQITAESDECFLLRDKKRQGCEALEFTDNERRIGQLEKVLAELYVFIDEQSAAGELLVDDEEKYLERVKAKEAGEFINLDGFVDIVCVTDDDQDQIRCFSKKDASPQQIELPEVKPRQVTSVAGITFKPSESECNDDKKINFKTFTSTWLSVSPSGIEYINNQVTLSDIGEFINLEEEIDPLDIEAPHCEAKYSASVSMFDHLPSIADKDKLIYSPENVLREVIEGIASKKESVDKIGTRIARALHKNRTSWALGCLGALYWRVQGDAPNAINCLRMALMNASHDNKHIPLLSLANILHKAGSINDALEIALAALESSPETVVIHFSIGNMYAAKDDFQKAVEYYQSTLALQDEFEPARERLISILCGGLLKVVSEEDDDNDTK